MTLEIIVSSIISCVFGGTIIGLLFRMNGTLGGLLAEDRNQRHRINNVEQVQTGHSESIKDHEVRISVLEQKDHN